MSDQYAPRGSFSIGEVIEAGFRTLNRNWLNLMVLTALPWVLAYGLGYVGAFGATTTRVSNGTFNFSMAGGFTAFALTLLIVIVYLVCQAALTFAVVEQLRGRRAALANALSLGLGRVGRMIGISLVIFIAYIVFVVVIGLVAFILPASLSFLLIILVAVIGGLMLVSAYFVLFPVASIEEQGVFGSFARTRFLTYGYRGPIFGLVLILIVASIVLNIAVAFLLRAALPLTVGLIVSAIVQIWLSTLFSVLIATTYFRLRYLKEGADLNQIASVFD